MSEQRTSCLAHLYLEQTRPLSAVSSMARPGSPALLPVSDWSASSTPRWAVTGALHLLCLLLVLTTAPVSLWYADTVHKILNSLVRFVLYRVREYERAVVLGSTLDRAEVRGPGLVLVLPCLQQLQIIDIRTKVFEVRFQSFQG